MKIFLVIVLWTLNFLLYAEKKATPETVFFFDSKKVDSGTIYSYNVTTLKGEYPTWYYWYVQSNKQIEVLQIYYPSLPTYAEQTFKYDLSYFMNTELISSQYYLDEKFIDFTEFPIQISYLATFDPVSKLFTGKETFFDPKTKTKRLDQYTLSFPIIPHFEYSNQAKDIAYIFRFIKPDVKSFLISVSSFGYSIECSVRYKGMDNIDGQMCRLYEMNGIGLISRLTGKGKAQIWMSADDPESHMVQFIGYSPSYGDYSDGYSVKLKKIEQSNDENWKAFKETIISENKDRLSSEGVF